MATPVDHDSIFGPLLQKTEAFQQQLVTAISTAASLNKDLETQYRRKIAALEAEIEKIKGPRASADLPPQTTPTPKLTRMIDGIEYVTRDEYNILLKSLQYTSKKYPVTKQKLDHLTDDAEPEKRGCLAQGDKQRELDMERAKVKEFERKFGTITQLLDVSQTVLQTVIKTSTDAAKQYKKYGEEDDLWKAEVLKKGTITSSDFERRPSRDSWPNIAAPLKHLSMSISGHNVMRARGQSMPPPAPTGSTPSASTPCPPGKLPPRLIKSTSTSPIRPPTQDPDATSDEEGEEDGEEHSDEPESALQKFSPTSRAIMRKPGSETLAVLHPEPLSPIQSHHTEANREVTEDGLANLKSEPVSEPDWYSKYGYSRIADDEGETFDLDNITAARRGSVGLRGFGQVITTPEKNGIRSPFLTQSSLSQPKKPPATTSGSQPATLHPNPVQNEPTVVGDTLGQESDPSPKPARTAKLKGDPALSTKAKAALIDPLPPKQRPPQELGIRNEVPAAIDHRSPLGEIRDPNGLPEPGIVDIAGTQSGSRRNRLGSLPANKEAYNKENPTTAKSLMSLLSTPDNRLPHVLSRSTGALKLKRKDLGSTPLAKQSIRRSSLNFPPIGPSTDVVETAHAATPGGKRSTEEPQGSSHKKKQRVEEATTPMASTAAQKPDNPFSPSKFRINRNRNDGLDFAFGEVVRDKARKDCLPKCVKECCRDLASGKLHEMWNPPAPYTSAKFGARDSPPPGEEKEEEEAKKNDQYREWNAAREKSERNLRFGRHRAQHQKAAEVIGYWESDFPTTQLLEEQRKESEKRHMEKGFDRYEQANKGGMYERRA
ncbi:hypothetical protein TWF718_003281 [Orbilia javanica]|uniref:DNA endonuclease activator Ctp1 C-terminal domain-containing protein n=1 Tax=Orbilia javanica TaxID=47235 RepID=A0AAN8R8V7_9PEZI